MRKILFLAGPLFLTLSCLAQHAITLNWQLPPASVSWTHTCGSGAGYDCRFLVWCYVAGTPGELCYNHGGDPTAPCSTNAGDYNLYNETGANAITYVDSVSASPGSGPLPGDSRCYGVSTVQSGLQSPIIFLNATLPGLPSEFLASTVYAGNTTYFVTPCRVVDTRNPNGPLGGPSLTAGTSRDFPVQSSSCGIPSTAQGYIFDVTVVPSTGNPGYVEVYPTGAPMPWDTNLSPFGNETITNEVTVEAGTNGSVTVYSSVPLAVIIDVKAYLAP